MAKQPDYSTYSLTDLKDFRAHCNSTKYPEKARLLDEAIRRRQANLTEEPREVPSINLQRLDKPGSSRTIFDDDTFLPPVGEYAQLLPVFDRWGLIADFDGPDSTTKRMLFVILLLLLSLLFIFPTIPNYPTKALAQTHRFDVVPSSVLCQQHSPSTITGPNQFFFDLHIRAGNDMFTALNVPQAHCQQIAKQMKTPSKLSLWHHRYLIHQLGSEGKEDNLLPYQQQVKQTKAVIDAKNGSHWLNAIGLLILWLLAFRTLVNAIKPGSFKPFSS